MRDLIFWSYPYPLFRGAWGFFSSKVRSRTWAKALLCHDALEACFPYQNGSVVLFFLANTAALELWVWLPKTCLESEKWGHSTSPRPKKIRHMQEMEIYPPKVPFWWITLTRPEQNCIFHLIHNSLSHRSFFCQCCFLFSGIHLYERSRSAFPPLVLLFGWFSVFFSWPIVWHILSIIYHDPSCFSYLKLGGQSVWARDSRNMTDYFWLFLPRKFWCQILLGGFGALEQALQNSEKSFSTPSLPSKLLVVQLHSTQQYSKIWTMLAVQISCCILERKLMEVENMKKVLPSSSGTFSF